MKDIHDTACASASGSGGNRPASGKLGEIEQAGGHLGERRAVDQQGRHLAGGIDCEELGRTMFLLVEGERFGVERHADLVQGDVHRHRARARAEIERERRHAQGRRSRSASGTPAS